MEKELKYIVNPNKKTVVCIGKDCKYDAKKFIYKAFDNTKNFGIFIGHIEPLLFLRDTYAGVAKCDPRDEFSIEEGKRIARGKMLAKYTKAKYKAVNDFEEVLFSTYCNIHDMKNEYKFKVDIARGAVDPNNDVDLENYCEGNAIYF